MTPIRELLNSPDFMLAVAAREVDGYVPLNKFGRNPVINTASDPEDVWTGGGIWVPPTTARVHNLASSSAADTSAGTGARTVIVRGLRAWGQEEFSETVTLLGATLVPTVNSYVIIYRMECLTFGSGEANAGTITATAVSDATVTAEIAIGIGQTQMAIFGVPSNMTAYVVDWWLNMNKGGGAVVSADCDLLVNARPDQADGGYVSKHHLGTDSHVAHPFTPYLKIAGPAILAVRVATVSGNGADVSAGFDGICAMNA